MRSASILALLVTLTLFVSCGGEEYSDVPPTGDPNAAQPGQPGQPGETPTQPEVEVPKASPDAAKLQGVHRMVDRMQEYDAKRDKALTNAESWLKPDISKDAIYFRGMLFEIAEDYNRAADDFKMFCDACPGDVNEKWGLYRAVDTLCKADRTKEAPKYLARFAEKFPDMTKYLKAMTAKVGGGLVKQGDFGDAVPVLKRAVAMGDVYAGQEMVQCLWAAGKYAEAKTEAAELKRNFDGHPEQARYVGLAARADVMGKPAPALSVNGWAVKDNGSFDPSELSGKVHLVYFWFLPKIGFATKVENWLKGVQSKYAGEGFRMVGISKAGEFDIVENKPVQGLSPEEELEQLGTWIFNKHTDHTWPLGLDMGGAIHDAFGYWKPPSYALIDKKGVYRYFRSGGGADDVAALMKVIELLLKE